VFLFGWGACGRAIGPCLIIVTAVCFDRTAVLIISAWTLAQFYGVALAEGSAGRLAVYIAVRDRLQQGGRLQAFRRANMLTVSGNPDRHDRGIWPLRIVGPKLHSFLHRLLIAGRRDLSGQQRDRIAPLWAVLIVWFVNREVKPTEISQNDSLVPIFLTCLRAGPCWRLAAGLSSSRMQSIQILHMDRRVVRAGGLSTEAFRTRNTMALAVFAAYWQLC